MTSIPALLFYDKVLHNANYVIGAGANDGVVCALVGRAVVHHDERY